MDQATHNKIVSYIWGIADDVLRDLFKRGKYPCPREALGAAKKLFIDSVNKEDDGSIELIIGGVMDNSVGIIHVPNGVAPPPITPHDYIYVERVLDGWYVFKTT